MSPGGRVCPRAGGPSFEGDWAQSHGATTLRVGGDSLRSAKGEPHPAGQRRHHATFTLNPPAYFTGSLPSQTTPSISFEVRMSSFGTLILAAAAACL